MLILISSDRWLHGAESPCMTKINDVLRLPQTNFVVNLSIEINQF